MQRTPRADLAPFVQSLWLSSSRGADEAPRHEHVLPTGQMHLVFRLSGPALKVFADPKDTSGATFGHQVVGGARARFYRRDISTPVSSVGVMLRPGAAEALFGVPAEELAGRHTPLTDLWGSGAGIAHERLTEATSPEQRLAVLEEVLANRLRRPRALHPAVAAALPQVMAAQGIRKIVADSGYSHRTFIQLFRRATGLGPKEYARVIRFQQLLRHLEASPETSWTSLSQLAGYSDQAHMIREFRDITGMTPQTYRHARGRESHHVPVDA